jgi:hypothetical protein
MPYYSSASSRKPSSRSAKSTKRAHSRECLAQSISSQDGRPKESIREVTLKLMALMKAKRETTPSR